MAIQDRIEVLVFLPAISAPLHEFKVEGDGPGTKDLVPWAVGARQQETFIISPEGMTFGISIRLMPLFNFGNADGIHISLKIDDGRVVNHFYSIKFSEMKIVEEGGVAASICTAIIRKGDNFRSTLFSFGTSGGHGLDNKHDPNALLPEGTISVTIIRVTHHKRDLKPAFVLHVFRHRAVETDASQSAISDQSMVPIDLNVVRGPFVTEQVAHTASKAVRFLFHYQPCNLSIMTCIAPSEHDLLAAAEIAGYEQRPLAGPLPTGYR